MLEVRWSDCVNEGKQTLYRREKEVEKGAVRRLITFNRLTRVFKSSRKNRIIWI